jgi:hypothetical protein
MKKIFTLSAIYLTSIVAYTQTTLKYSGNATTNFFGFNYKIAGIGEMDVPNSTEQIGTHIGLFGQSTNGLSENVGIYGTTKQNTIGSSGTYIGVYGNNLTNAINSSGSSVFGGLFFSKNIGTNSIIKGIMSSASGVNNSSNVVGVDATAYNPFNTSSNNTIAVRGITTSSQSSHLDIYKEVANPGGYFSSNDGQGIYATTTDGFNYSGGKVSNAITGYSNLANAANNNGVVGVSEGTGQGKVGVFAGVVGAAPTGIAAGIFAYDGVGATNSFAGWFSGNVRVNGNFITYGTFNATGTKNFMIDHPLDPENKILRHAAMESNEVLNQYSGNIITDASGFATVTLPDYFETLNTNFRYQLTTIGSFSQVIVKKKVANNKFIIQSKDPNIEVSWQVTGVRNDKVMQYQPFIAETEKTGNDKGNYLSPEAYGKPKKQAEQMIPAFGHEDSKTTKYLSSPKTFN